MKAIKANSVARENAIVEHRKRVDQQIEEEKNVIKFKKLLKKTMNTYRLRLQKLYDSGNLDKIQRFFIGLTTKTRKVYKILRY